MFAILGDSAAGKTMLASGIAAFLGAEGVLEICTDDYHRYDRAERKIRAITRSTPTATTLMYWSATWASWRRGSQCSNRCITTRTGHSNGPSTSHHGNTLSVEGLLGLHTAAMRSHYDVSVYLDPPEELRHVWKIKRDKTNRNYTREAVLAELETRDEDSARFIPPETDEGDAHGRFNVRLLLRSRLPHPELSDVLAIAKGDPPPLRWSVLRESGRLTEVVEIDSNVSDEVH